MGVKEIYREIKLASDTNKIFKMPNKSIVQKLQRGKKWRQLYPGIPCHQCGFDLTKDYDKSHCPECGYLTNWNPDWHEDGFLNLWWIRIASFLAFSIIFLPMFLILYVVEAIQQQYSNISDAWYILAPLWMVLFFCSLLDNLLGKYFNATLYTRSYRNFLRRSFESVYFFLLGIFPFFGFLYLLSYIFGPFGQNPATP